MVARVTLYVAAALMVIGLVLSALSTFEVGLDEPLPRSAELAERIIDNFEVFEDEYLTWGRWVNLTTAFAFGFFALGLSCLIRLGRARAAMLAGAVVVAVSEALDLAQLQAIRLAREALDNDLAFAPPNVFRVGIHVASTYVGVVGLLLIAAGLVMAGVRSHNLRLVSLLLAATALVLATPWIWNLSPWQPIAHTMFVAFFVVWCVLAVRHDFASPPPKLGVAASA